VSDGDIKMAYIYAAIILVLWYFDQLQRQAGFIEGGILASRVKSALSMLLYSKVSSLTSYVIKNSKLGKITNLIASDMRLI
jgi:hypothetical protein